MKPAFFAKTALLALSIAILAPFASADTVTFTGSTVAGDTFSGTLTVVPDVNGVPNAYDIIHITGNVDVQGVSQSINSAASAAAYSGPFVFVLEQPGNSPSGQFDIDDLYFSVGNAFDYDGMLAILQDGTEFNLYYGDDTPGSGGLEEDNGYSSPFASFTSTLIPSSPIPEPSSLALFGTGILGLAGVARRRFKA